MTEEDKKEFTERLNNISEQYARGIAIMDDHGTCYGVEQTRAEAGLQELIILLQDVINAL